MGQNGPEAQEETWAFLRQLVVVCDHIVVLYGSPWMNKTFELMTISNLPVAL